MSQLGTLFWLRYTIFKNSLVSRREVTTTIFNATTNTVGVLTGLAHGEVCYIEPTRRLVTGLADEGKAGKVLDFNTFGEPFAALRNGQVDAVVLDQATLYGQLQTISDLRTIGEPLYYHPKPDWAEAEKKAPYILGGTAIGVSNPDFGEVVTGESAVALRPPRTRHDRTWVAPFQLAYTIVLPPVRRAAAEGGLSGMPTHGSTMVR